MSRLPDEKDWTRRAFLSESVRRGGALGAGIALPGIALDSAALAATPTAAVGLDASRAAPRIRKRATLGRTGIEVPDISFGTFSLEHDEKLVLHALERGVTHFDSAEGYTEGRA